MRVLIFGFLLVFSTLAFAGLSPFGAVRCRVLDFDRELVRLDCGSSKKSALIKVPKSYFREKFDLRPDAVVNVTGRAEDLFRNLASGSKRKVNK